MESSTRCAFPALPTTTKPGELDDETPPGMTRLYQPAVSIDGIMLRPAGHADEAAFRRIYAEVRAPELASTGWSTVEKKQFCDAQYALQDEHYRRYYADFEPWAICCGDCVAGRLCLATFDGNLILMDISIAVSHRCRGIGTALLADVLRQADLLNREVRLHVEPDNPAKRLYERLGFIEIGEAGIYQEMRRWPLSSAS